MILQSVEVRQSPQKIRDLSSEIIIRCPSKPEEKTLVICRIFTLKDNMFISSTYIILRFLRFENEAGISPLTPALAMYLVNINKENYE